MDFIDFMTWCVCWSIYLSYDSIPCLYTHEIDLVKTNQKHCFHSVELVWINSRSIYDENCTSKQFPSNRSLSIFDYTISLSHSLCVCERKLVYNKSKYLLSQSVPLYCSRIESSVEWSSSYYHQHSIPYSSWESRIEITSLKDFV